MFSDEWEYEYSPDQTESLYFTLDLTTHVPDALTDLPLPTSGQTPKHHSAPRTDPSLRHSDASSGEEEEEVNQESLPVLQILDLHTSNPLIKYNQSIYSAYWTSDLGTQFHIAQTGQTSDPLRKGTILDVLGISRARLLGRPVQLVDRNAPLQTITSRGQSTQTTSTAIDVDEEEYAEDDESMVLTSGPLKIPRAILKTAKSKSQASFLERLSAIKHRKGEKDQVPILAVKHYTKPANAEEIKRKAEDDDRNNALIAVDGKRRRRRRPMGIKPRNAGGAGRPSRDDIEGMLGYSTTDGAMEMDGGLGEGPVGVGMFEPGGRGEMREDVVGFLEDPFQVGQISGVGEERHPGTPAIDLSSPASHERSKTVAGEPSSSSSTRYKNPHGYLSFQTRAEYLSTVRAEGMLKPPSQPLRPPWMSGEEGEEQTGQDGEQDGDEAGAEA